VGRSEILAFEVRDILLEEIAGTIAESWKDSVAFMLDLCIRFDCGIKYLRDKIKKNKKKKINSKKLKMEENRIEKGKKQVIRDAN